jgi:hypothetical protein
MDGVVRAQKGLQSTESNQASTTVRIRSVHQLESQLLFGLLHRRSTIHAAKSDDDGLRRGVRQRWSQWAKKDMLSYGKSTSGSFKLLPSKDGLRCYGGCFRLVFSFPIVFWDHLGLTYRQESRIKKIQWQATYRDRRYTSNGTPRRPGEAIVNRGLIGMLA